MFIINKDKYVEYLTTVNKRGAVGQKLKTESQYSYFRQLDNISHKMLELRLTNKSLFNINDIRELDEIYKYFKTNPIIEKMNRTGNNQFTAAFNHYRNMIKSKFDGLTEGQFKEFIVETTSSIDNQDEEIKDANKRITLKYAEKYNIEEKNNHVEEEPIIYNTNDIIDEKIFFAEEEKRQKGARLLDVDKLRTKAKNANSSNESYVKVKHYDRDPNITEYTKIRANGICELCKSPAPFKDKDGVPYLESHHLITLADKGPDSICNTVALCPNCHRKMHSLNLVTDKMHLITTLHDHLQNEGDQKLIEEHAKLFFKFYEENKNSK